MRIGSARESLFLLAGDVVLLYASLWVALAVRSLAMPTEAVWALHVVPFTFVFMAWVLVAFIVGLYEKQTLIVKQRMPAMIAQTSLAASAVALTLFYLVPYFGIAPKTSLFLFILVSSGLAALWRLVLAPAAGVSRRERIVIIGSGPEVGDLSHEIAGNDRYGFSIAETIDPGSLSDALGIAERVRFFSASVVAVDTRDPRIASALPDLYALMFDKVRFADIAALYEEVFDRVPLGLVRHDWFLEHISGAGERGYDIVKRAFDVTLSVILGIPALAFIACAAAAVVLEDRGPVFFSQVRVGKGNLPVRIWKIRTMKSHDEDDGVAKEPSVTRVGKFLRSTRIDELPQLWNVLLGDLSMIGPRPEIPTLADVYEAEVPYYRSRHIVKPGLSGWAQLRHTAPPKFTTNVSQTKDKLSYDLYYIKNRSIALDLKIALRTLKVLLSREGV